MGRRRKKRSLRPRSLYFNYPLEKIIISTTFPNFDDFDPSKNYQITQF